MLVSGFGSHAAVTVTAEAGAAHASSRIATIKVAAWRTTEDRADGQLTTCSDRDRMFAERTRRHYVGGRSTPARVFATRVPPRRRRQTIGTFGSRVTSVIVS